MAFQNGLVPAKSVLKADKSGTSTRIEHGFQGHDRQVPKNVLEHQSGITGAGHVMSHLRETFVWCRAGARRMCHTQGKPVEEHMFITGRVKDRVEMSGPHTRCLTTPSGSCAMLHFDSMVLPFLPHCLCVSLCLSACTCLCTCLSLSLYLHLSLSLHLCVPVCFCLCKYLCLSLQISLALSECMYAYMCVAYTCVYTYVLSLHPCV